MAVSLFIEAELFMRATLPDAPTGFNSARLERCRSAATPLSSSWLPSPPEFTLAHPNVKPWCSEATESKSPKLVNYRPRQREHCRIPIHLTLQCDFMTVVRVMTLCASAWFSRQFDGNALSASRWPF